jgi:hypothetical protein
VTFPRLVGFSIISLTVAVSLTGCGGLGSPGSGAPAAPATSAPAATKTLDFATVQSLTAPRFQKDPNCAYGEWSENKTGIDEKFRSGAKTIEQFDCYLKKADVGGLPKRIQQSIYVEFSSDTTAKAFAQDQSVLYATLVDGPHVVVAGTGLDSVDMKAYLADLKNACGCGEIIAPSS